MRPVSEIRENVPYVRNRRKRGKKSGKQNLRGTYFFLIKVQKFPEQKTKSRGFRYNRENERRYESMGIRNHFSLINVLI